MNRTVSIHQPNFFPWLGYFNKIARSDIFVFLDDVQVIKTGSSWFNRVMLPCKDRAEGIWMTVPIRRPSGLQLISTVEISEATFLKDKFLKSLRLRYAKFPFTAQTMELIGACIEKGDPNLSTFNMNAVKLLCSEMKLSSCTFVSSSELKTEGHSTEKLVDITKKVNAETYLCGGGASDYFDESLFQKAGLKVQYQNFKPKPYPQYRIEKFIPGMSIIDLLMNVGVDSAKEFII